MLQSRWIGHCHPWLWMWCTNRLDPPSPWISSCTGWVGHRSGHPWAWTGYGMSSGYWGPVPVNRDVIKCYWDSTVPTNTVTLVWCVCLFVWPFLWQVWYNCYRKWSNLVGLVIFIVYLCSFSCVVSVWILIITLKMLLLYCLDGTYKEIYIIYKETQDREGLRASLKGLIAAT